MAAQEMEQNGGSQKPTINTKHILFIMSGAFPGLEDSVKQRTGCNGEWYKNISGEDLVNYGMEAEFVGRLPVRVGLNNLSKNDLFEILKRSGDSIIKQYVRDFESYDIKAEFTDESLRAFAYMAAKETTGARALTGIIEAKLLDFMYELPSQAVSQFNFQRFLNCNTGSLLAILPK